MAEGSNASVVAWILTALLVILLALSAMGDGTWMNGIGMGWMMGLPLVLLAALLYVAYRYGRMEKAVEQLEQRKPKP